MKTGEPGDAVSRVLLPAVLDDATTRELGPEVRRLAADPAQGWIILDARDVTVLSSAALGLLAAVALVTRRRGAHAVVINCAPGWLGLLRVARLSASTTDCPAASEPPSDGDWTPWWSCAAANA